MVSDPSAEIRVDIGMPTRGRSPWIEEAIESILAQTFGAWRLVVSENSEGSPECARALAPYLDDPRITHHVTGRDLGLAGNLTGLIRRGTAPYVALLHDDDRWRPEFLERRVAFLDAHPGCGLVFGHYVTIDEAGRKLDVSPPRLEPGEHAPAEVLPVYIEHTPIGVPTLLVRRAAYEAVGAEFVDGLAWTDHEMWFRIAARFPIGFLDVADSDWRTHRNQTTQQVRLWGEHLARMHALFEETLDAVPEVEIDRTLLHRKHGREALQAALDVLERGDLARARAYLDTALAKDPSLRRDRRAVLLRATLPLGARAARALVRVRRASWWVNRRLPADPVAVILPKVKRTWRAADPYRDLDVIDSRAPRFNQAVVGLLSLLAVVTGWWWLLGLLALQLAVGLTLGRRWCVPCVAYFELVQPRFGEGPLEDSRPPRFANMVGVVFLGSATIAYALGAETLGLFLGTLVGALALLSASTGICAGCEAYKLGCLLRGRPFVSCPVPQAPVREAD